MLNRRSFLKTSIATATFAAFGSLPWAKAWAWYQSQSTPLWKTTFRGVGPDGIPVAAPDGLVGAGGATHYSLNIGQFTDQIHPTLGPTTFWGYDPANPLGGGSQPQKHLGGIIVGQRGSPIQLTFTNNLPSTHIIPVDRTIEGADRFADNRADTHLHGGLVPWTSDGGPHAWFGADGAKGASYVDVGISPAPLAGNQAEYYYPLNQSARLLWYHDHAWGITRVNAYAGIATALVLRDTPEANLQNNGLPPFIESSVLGGTTVQELPIVVQDKVFVGKDIFAVDPTWPGPSTDGSLWYAHVYDTARFGPQGTPPGGGKPLGLPPISVVPEFFGDTMLANGTVYPEVTVEARRYRFRILNACNARFLNLQMYVDDGSPNGITLSGNGNPANAPARNAAAPNPAGKPSTNFLVLGTEGGFLPTAQWVPSNVPFAGLAGGSLLLAPAERADVIFDFSAHVGQKIILYTDTPAPFPGGDPLNDYFPGLNNKNPTNALTAPGFGPNTRVIMRFKVVAASGRDTPLTISKGFAMPGTDPLFAPLGVTALPAGVPVRQLTLNETFDDHGRLAQLLGTTTALVAGTFGRPYISTPTETPSPGAMEVWQIANTTADTHPIHFHLVNVQILSRQPFNGIRNGVPALTGQATPPAPFEQGWKETVRMNPGEVTTVMMQFNLPAVPFNVPSSPRTGGNEYVWHCHILEHEEHDMMRPLIVG
ncbi:MAG TPA: multicopper oxidase domain-containing protein [Burkholderiales bacterium]|nr:multicopper oxidase domain-containing protein [Burkholderiales bacterium]